MPLTPWVTRLLVANVVMYVVTLSLPQLFNQLLLIPALVPQRPWTAVTYMFLHAGLWHLLFNMIALYFFGPRLEMRLGGRHFLGLYFVSGLLGAALSFPFTPFARIVGASGAVFGVLMGFAMYWPRDRIYIWGILGVEARWFVIIMTVLSLYGGIGGAGGIAHFAHLGGFAGGYLYLKWLERRSPSRRFRERARGDRKKKAGRAEIERWSKIPREELHPINREELDRVMRKIDEDGVGSLTQEERAFLDRFSRR